MFHSKPVKWSISLQDKGNNAIQNIYKSSIFEYFHHLHTFWKVSVQSTPHIYCLEYREISTPLRLGFSHDSIIK